MTQKKLVLLLITLCLLSFWLFTNRSSLVAKINLGKSSLGIDQDKSNRSYHPVAFFEEDTFYAGVSKAKKENSSFTSFVSGGIIPHHLLVSFIIADFFNRLAAQQPKTIILIGPNHKEIGDFKVLTSIYGWQTPIGQVEPNESIITNLLKKNLVKIDENILPKDHSLSGIMPFIKYYLPNTQVVPLLLSSYISQDQAYILANHLKDYINKDVIIIASVDFSHYLTNQQAQKKDQVTLKIMKNFDYKQLFSLDSDYLDSPPSIGVLLMTMQMLGKTEMELLHNTNSGKLQKDDYIETTSYFSVAYY